MSAINVSHPGVTADEYAEQKLQEPEYVDNLKILDLSERTIVRDIGIRSTLMHDLSKNQLVQFSVISFVIMLILAIALSTIISIRLKQDVELLKAHGEAMMAGELKPSDPYSIPNIVEDVDSLRLTTFGIIGGAFVILYLSLSSIVWRGVVERKQLEGRLHELLTQMETLAMTDSLTGLLNRRAIHQRATIEWNRVYREDSAMSLILIDADRFKAVNDQHGHLVGDQVLRVVADTIIQNKRSYDLAGRWGGEEFLLVLPGATLSDAGIVAERIRVSVDALKLQLPGYGVLRVQVSEGVTRITKETGVNLGLDVIMSHADDALYRAKKEGRNL